MRMSLEGQIWIKFLIRYEVGTEDLDNSSRFRFTRLVLNIRCEKLYLPKYRINLSSKDPGTFLVNL